MKITKKTKLKFKIEEIILAIICLFPITTFTAQLVPFSINRVFTLITVSLILIHICKNIKLKEFILISTLIFFFMVSCIFAVKINENISDYIYFATTMLLVYYFSKLNTIANMKAIAFQYKQLIRGIAILDTMVIILMLFIPKCYTAVWGMKFYFTGFASNAHTMASACCLLLSIIIFYVSMNKFKWYYLIWIMLISFAVFMTGARIFIIPVILLDFLYLENGVHSKKTRYSLALISILILAYIVINSNVWDKMIWSMDAKNQYAVNNLASFSGGRSEFWRIDLKAFFDSKPLNFLIGHGFDFVYDLNYKEYNIYIWAHNDVIDLLLSIGLIGASFYLYCWKKFTDLLRKITDNKKNFYILVLYIFAPMLLNGLFTAQHYLYSVFIITLLVSSYKSGFLHE